MVGIQVECLYIWRRVCDCTADEKEYRWIENEEMLDLVAIAQSSPGAIAVNAAILVGYHVAGISGALLTVLGTVIPPMIIISVISMFYQAFRDNPVVNLVMAGMLCGVAAVIFDVVIDMTKTIFEKKKILPVLVLIGAFIAVRFFSVNILLVILVCGIIGILETWQREKTNREAMGK